MNATTTDEAESFDATELGSMMREMRENLGHDLESVAEDLRIRLVYLESIESGRLSDLPGNAYVSGFLRAYSDYLGLDGEEIVRRFKMAGAEISSKTQLHLPSPVEEGRLPTAFILMVAAVIAAAAYGGWYFLSVEGKGPMETVAKLPRELSGLVDGAKNQTEVSTPATTESETPATMAPKAETNQDTPPGLTGTEEPSEPSESADSSAATTATGSDASGTVSADANTPAAETAAETAAQSGSATPEAETAAPSTETAANNVSETVEKPPRVENSTLAGSETPAPANTSAAPVETAREALADRTQTQTNAVKAEQPRTPAAKPPAVSTTEPAATPPPAASSPSPEPAQAAALPRTQSPADRSSDVVRIVIRATADSYVAVRTADNETLFAQLMRAGDSYEVPSGADLLLETGNAGALRIIIGGKRAPSLGAVGDTKRNIPLDADKLLRGLN